MITLKTKKKSKYGVQAKFGKKVKIKLAEFGTDPIPGATTLGGNQPIKTEGNKLDNHDNVRGLNAAGPMPKQGGYQAAQGPVFDQSQSEFQPIQSQQSDSSVPTSTERKPKNNKFGKFLGNTFNGAKSTDVVAGLVQGINALIPQSIPKDNQKHLVDAVNPYPMGTNSQATFDNGGEIPEAKKGFKINPKHKGWCTPLSNPHCTGKRRTFALNAKRHFKKKHEYGGEIAEDGNQTPLNRDNYNAFEAYAFQNDPNYGKDSQNHGNFANSTLDAFNKANPTQAIQPNDLPRYFADMQANPGEIKSPYGVNKNPILGQKMESSSYRNYTGETQNAAGKTTGTFNGGTNQNARNAWLKKQQDSEYQGFGNPKSDVNFNQNNGFNQPEQVQPIKRDASFPTLEEAKAKAKGQTQKSNWHTGDTDYSYKAEDGTTMQPGEDGLYVENNKVSKIGKNPFTGDTVQFNGPKHTEGGIDMEYGGQPVEVEGGETGFVDKKGAFNVFGNLHVPGTSMKFKDAGKLIAKHEKKANKIGDLGTKLINESDPDNKFENPTFNTGAVLQDAHMQRQKQLADTKEYLSTIQNKMLDLAKFSGADPKDVSRAFKGKGKFGLKIKMDRGGEVNLDGKDPNEYKSTNTLSDQDLNAYRESEGYKPIGANPRGPKLPGVSPESPSKEESINLDGPSFVADTKKADADYKNWEAIPKSKDKTPSQTHKFIRDNVKISDVLPEISELFDKPDPVARQQFNPTLYTPYQVSFEDRIAENQGDFNAIERTMSHNPSALGALAAQKYNLNNQTHAEEFRTNQGINDRVNNQNVGIINQSKEMNLKLADEQMVRQAQAKENTRSNRFAAMNSISDKIAQNRRNNKTMQIEEGMYHYHLDKDGHAVYDGPKYQLQEERIGMADINPKDKEKSRTYPYDPEKDYTEEDKDSKFAGGSVGGHGGSRGNFAGRWYGASDDSDKKKKKKHTRAKSF